MEDVHSCYFDKALRCLGTTVTGVRRHANGNHASQSGPILWDGRLAYAHQVPGISQTWQRFH